ncbi:hypothetical protein [Novosphingobium pokkalii]|uniref:Reverse transcriptase domain-containing protein n=1 Tax=Novosphingobium pokkalii TaxID=1770194 RepID=A0ABV7V7W9_9SPHN|nr:hypothetical protein [Novosphingobium pokkalii]GHD02132.1 hypothetical protein GCM10019060_37190 [Novosphingobium pokkalii]
MAIATYRRYRRRLLATIARHAAMADRSEIAAAQLEREKERYLLSHAVQAAIFYDIWRDRFGLEEAQQRLAQAERMPRWPHRYQMFDPQTVTFFNKPRTTEGFRKICQFTMVEAMWHEMARDLIVAQHQPRPHIGDWKGRGRDRQIDGINAMLASSRQAVVSADVVSAFASVNIDAVYDLQHLLPEQLIRRAIDYRTHRFMRRERSEYAHDIHRATCNGHHDDLERSPSGLMEGSPVSNAIFSVLMDDLADHVGEGIQTFVYCDNIVLIAPSMSLALRAQEALARYLSGHRAGPFEMRSCVTSVIDGFEHVGYQLRKRPRARTIVGPSLVGWKRLVDRIFEGRGATETAQWMSASYSRTTPQAWAEFMDMARHASTRTTA